MPNTHPPSRTPPLRTRVLQRLMLERQVAFWTHELAPLYASDAPGQHRARVVAIVQETPDTKTFVLRPRRTLAHQAGQYVSLEVEVDGVRLTRCYSLSSAPGSDEVSITVKHVPGGRVSGHLHERLRVGDVVRLREPTGDFVLPAAPRGPLLFVSGGSGITPLMSMARDLARRGELHDVVWVHHARTRADVAFGAELESLARTQPGLRLQLCLDDTQGSEGAAAAEGAEGAGHAPSAHRGFHEARFRALVPDFASRLTWLCGPAPMMERVQALYDEAGAAQRLTREAFVSAPPMAPHSDPAAPVNVALVRSERSVVARGAGSLLEQLERAGERPPSGCRVGICHTCRCTKQRGTVENLLSGEVSSDPNQVIQLCISRALTDLELDLA